MFNFNPSFLSKFGQNTGVVGPQRNDNPNAAFNKGAGIFGSQDNQPRMHDMRMRSPQEMQMREMPLHQKLPMMFGSQSPGMGFMGNQNPMMGSMMPQNGMLAELLRRQFPNFRT